MQTQEKDGRNQKSALSKAGTVEAADSKKEKPAAVTGYDP